MEILKIVFPQPQLLQVWFIQTNLCSWVEVTSLGDTSTTNVAITVGINVLVEAQHIKSVR